MELITALAAKFAEEQGAYRLLVRRLTFSSSCSSRLTRMSEPQIVDSILALFRVDYAGRGELSDRQQK